jgi:LysM repeat protein
VGRPLRGAIASRAAGRIRTWTLGLAALCGVATSGPAQAGSLSGAPTWCVEVRRGESLAAIARRAGTSLGRIRRANALGRGDRVRPGDILALPLPTGLQSGHLRVSAPALPARPGHRMRENAAADRQRLSRLRTRTGLERFVRAGLLVPVAAEAPGFRVVGVPSWRRVARPWTRLFIARLGEAVRRLFGGRLRVTDLSRTEAVQTALLAVNGNAAPAGGPGRSSHLTGASVDLSKAEHSERELQWLRLVLRRLARRGIASPIEEFAQPHFHVMVFREFADYARRLRDPSLIGGC